MPSVHTCPIHTALITREVQSNQTTRYHFTPISTAARTADRERETKPKIKLKITSAGEDVEIPCTRLLCVRNVNWYDLCGKPCSMFL